MLLICVQICLNEWMQNLQSKFLDSVFAGAELTVDRGSDQYLVSKYILDVLYENVSKFLITGGIALFLGIGNYFLFFALIYGSLKYYSYGAHLESSLLCLISGAVTYYGCIYAALYLNQLTIPDTIYCVMILICLFVYRRYAPAVSEKQFLLKERKPILNKRVQIYIGTLLGIQFLLPGIFRNLIVLALIAEAINIIPLAFVIFEGKGRR